MQDYRPAYRGALVASLGIFVIYLLTLAPSTALWDTSEYITTAHILGIPHPPGNPLFVSLAKVWTLLLAPLGLSIAVRVNLLAAVTSTVASAFFYLVIHRVLWGITRDRWVSLIGAGVALLIGGTAFTVWNQSNVNEKVYTLSVGIIGAVSWLAVRWLDRRDEPGSERYPLIALYMMVLGSTIHLMSLLPGPAWAVMVLVAGPSLLLRTSFWVRAILLVILGVSFNFFLPIRAAQNPVINEADPVCETASGAAVAVFTNGQRGCQPLAETLTRFQYQKPPLTVRMAPFADQMLNYFQYFDWQWSRGADTSEVPGNTRLLFTVLFGALGLLGFWMLWRSDLPTFLYFGTLMVTLSVGLVFYLNFKYGYSLGPPGTDLDMHEVRERDYFFVGGFMLWGVMSGLGLTGIWYMFSERIANVRRLVMASPALLVAVIPLALNWSWATRAGDYAARDWAYDLLVGLEPHSILFTHGDNDTFPLWYVQEVEGIRQDVTVIVVQYLYTPWYIKQLQELTTPGAQRLFVPEQTHGLFEAPAGPPTRSIISATHAEMDAVVGGRIPQDVTVPIGNIAVNYPADTYLDRGQRLALSVINNSIEERPIYFSSTGGLMSDLGLRRWAVKHGIPAKLVLRNLDEPSDSAFVRVSDAMGGDWFHLERSLTLAREIYQYRGLKERDIWADRSTLNIPWHFFALHLQLSDAVRLTGGDLDLAEALADDARLFQITSEGGPRGGAVMYPDDES